MTDIICQINEHEKLSSKMADCWYKPDDPEDRKKIRLYINMFWPSTVVSIIAFCYLLHEYDYIHEDPIHPLPVSQEPIIIILTVYHICKLILPFMHWFSKMTCGCVDCIYFLVFGCASISGGLSLSILGLFELCSQKFQPQFGLWIVYILTYVTDLLLFLRYNYLTRRRNPERVPLLQEEKIPEWVIDHPAVVKHAYYTTCAICIDDFKDGEDVKELTCKHIYHPKCIEHWMKDHNTCPMCANKI